MVGQPNERDQSFAPWSGRLTGAVDRHPLPALGRGTAPLLDDLLLEAHVVDSRLAWSVCVCGGGGDRSTLVSALLRWVVVFHSIGYTCRRFCSKKLRCIPATHTRGLLSAPSKQAGVAVMQPATSSARATRSGGQGKHAQVPCWRRRIIFWRLSETQRARNGRNNGNGKQAKKPQPPLDQLSSKPGR